MKVSKEILELAEKINKYRTNLIPISLIKGNIAIEAHEGVLKKCKICKV